MKSVVVAFNSQLKELVEKLSKIIPDNEDLRFAKNMFHVPIMTKENIYIEHFYTHALQFEDQIMTKNEDFFVNFNITDFFSVSEEISEKHKEVTNIWNTFDGKTKDAIWQYVQILYRLAKKYYK